MAAGTGLVEAFVQGATLYDRHQTRIASATAGYADSTMDYDLFAHNMVRARAEEHVGFVVNRRRRSAKSTSRRKGETSRGF